MNRRGLFLGAYRVTWAAAWLPLHLVSAHTLHRGLIGALRRADHRPAVVGLARRLNGAYLPPMWTQVGGVMLPHPVVLAAGLVKGDGFADEGAAAAAVDRGRDIIPGWRLAPTLLGAVEFGSYTRHPRAGHAGIVLWRDDATRSTQNRVGLRNPGARAAAAFLGGHATELPPVYGINLATSPGLTDEAAVVAELTEAATLFEDRLRATGRGPAWYTLNLSCPNTQDDPAALQTEAQARLLAGALVEAVPVPVWVKVGPGLSLRQYAVLVTALADAGAKAIIATNTLARPAPDGSGTVAGLGGGELRPHALVALRALARARAEGGRDLDLICCGGIMTRRQFAAARAAGAGACMVYSALVFRGPLAAALIQP